MAALGDVIYRGSSVWKRLVGNTTTTRKVLCQTGTGSGSAAPVWAAFPFDVTTVTLTDTQIKALPTSGITIVSAPASGYRVKLLSATLRANTSAGAYTNINTTYSALTLEVDFDTWLAVGAINDSTTSPSLTLLSDFLGVASAAVVDLPVPYAGVPATTTNGWILPQVAVGTTAYDGVAMKLMFDNNGSGNLTGGNAANTLRISVLSMLEAL